MGIFMIVLTQRSSFLQTTCNHLCARTQTCTPRRDRERQREVESRSIRMQTDLNGACETGQATSQMALKCSYRYELKQLWLYCFIWPLLQKISISLSLSAATLPSLCLKVTFTICQSLAKTLALSVIHHVGCVSTRCCTSRAVGGLCQACLLSTICKQLHANDLAMCVWQCISVDANGADYQLCVSTNKEVIDLSANTVTAHKIKRLLAATVASER